MPFLGRVDGFDQDKEAGKREEGGEVLGRLLAAQGDALEPFDLADTLLGAGAGFVECRGEEFRFGGAVPVRNDRADAAAARRGAVGLGVVSLVAEHGAWRDLRAEIEQRFEMPAVAGLAAGQVEGERQAVEIEFQVDFGGEAAARQAERLAVLPPFAPAAETWARTMVESTICTRCAVPLISAKIDSIASKTPRWLNRQNRFQTLFQGPNSAGKARQVML